MLGVIIFLFGLIIGSFLNCVIYRLHTGESAWKGRSFCPSCRHQLSPLDLIPVFSFLMLGGKCRYCRKVISWQYPLVELATGLLFVLLFNFQFPVPQPLFNFSSILHLLFLWSIASVFIVIFVYDLYHFIIPDRVLFPAILAVLAYRLIEIVLRWSLIDDWALKAGEVSYLGNYVLAAALASGFFLLLFLISKGTWIGFGDVKLALLLGLVLGVPNIFVGLFLAFFFGAIIGVGLMYFQKKGLRSEVPFAPFLIGGTFLAIMFGNAIVAWYLSLFFF